MHCGHIVGQGNVATPFLDRQRDGCPMAAQRNLVVTNALWKGNVGDLSTEGGLRQLSKKARHDSSDVLNYNYLLFCRL